jgi:hypothetical protein
MVEGGGFPTETGAAGRWVEDPPMRAMLLQSLVISISRRKNEENENQRRKRDPIEARNVSKSAVQACDLYQDATKFWHE